MLGSKTQTSQSMDEMLSPLQCNMPWFLFRHLYKRHLLEEVHGIFSLIKELIEPRELTKAPDDLVLGRGNHHRQHQKHSGNVPKQNDLEFASDLEVANAK